MPSVKRTFTIPDDVSAKLDQTVPHRERSKFIAMTLREALKERKRQELLAMLDEIEPKKNPTGIAAEDVMRKIRTERAQNVASNS